MRLSIALSLLLVSLAGAPALARPPAPNSHEPAGVLSLDAQASIEVPQDIVHITMFYEQEGSDPAALTNVLSQKAQQALAKTKGQTAVSVQTGTFTVYPRTDHDGRISVWRARTELLLESRDFAAASRVAGDLSPLLQVGGVSFSLSAQAARDAKNRLTEQAIASFREQAQSAAQGFGYHGYTIRRVAIDHSNAPPRPLLMAVHSGIASAAANVPLEGGKTTVTVAVSGSVQMTP